MAGKNIPKVSFNGIEKDHWIEGKESFARMINDPSSTHMNYESLVRRGISSKEAVAAPLKAENPTNLVKLGKVNLN